MGKSREEKRWHFYHSTKYMMCLRCFLEAVLKKQFYSGNKFWPGRSPRKKESGLGWRVEGLRVLLYRLCAEGSPDPKFPGSGGRREGNGKNKTILLYSMILFKV